MKKSIILSGLAVVSVLLTPSCAKMLEITPPNQITNEQVEELLKNGTDDQRKLVMTSMVNPMVQYFNYSMSDNAASTGSADVCRYSDQGIEWLRGVMANDLAIGYDKTSNQLAGRDYYWYEVGFRASNAATNASHWFGKAKAVNMANQVLDTFTKEAATSTLTKDGRARALLVRAYAYMGLMEEYQDAYLQGGKSKLGMSLYTTYNPGQSAVARSTAEETYKFIKDDINEAISLLKGAGIGFTGGRDNCEDMDLGLANFLLARVSLWTGDYATCISACQAIKSSGAYSLIKAENWGGRNTGEWTPTSEIEILPETNAFAALAVNPECILGFKRGSSYIGSGARVALANIFSTYAQNNTAARIDDRLYSKIADGDCRKDAFYVPEIGDYAYPTGTSKLPSYCNLKFAQTVGLTDAGTGNDGDKSHTSYTEFCQFRYAEVLLMLAEAQCMNNQEDNAKTTLNELLAARTKAGATTLTCDNYPSMANLTTLAKIQLQTRIEMWGENGREWYNNKRWGVNVDRTGSTVHPCTTAKLDAKNMTLEIPERELQDNPLCVKNGITE